MIAAALVGGLAGFWLWTVLNDEDGIFGPVTRLLHRTSVTRKWLVCPWCSLAWFSIAGSLVIYHPSPAPALVTALAAAGLGGLLGSYFEE